MSNCESISGETAARCKGGAHVIIVGYVGGGAFDMGRVYWGGCDKCDGSGDANCAGGFSCDCSDGCTGNGDVGDRDGDHSVGGDAVRAGFNGVGEVSFGGKEGDVDGDLGCADGDVDGGTQWKFSAATSVALETSVPRPMRDTVHVDMSTT